MLSLPYARPVRRAGLAVALLLIPQIALAQSCNVDIAAVEKSIARLEASYAGILSDIGCDAPVKKAHRLMCDSSDQPAAEIWRMGRLDDLAWVYAYENATKSEVDREDPPRDSDFIAKRDACTDIMCLCNELIAHTNDSLGGESPYTGG